MSEFLSDPMWAGIGVIVSVLIAFLGYLISHRYSKTESKQIPESIVPLPITAEKEALEGQLVRLRGKVWREMFPGPPNYQSIDDGDQPQGYWILNTKDPIEILGKSIEDGTPYSVGSSARFQLMLDPSFYASRQHLVFSDAWVEGRLVIGHTGHHKTKALIDVQKFEPI